MNLTKYVVGPIAIVLLCMTGCMKTEVMSIKPPLFGPGTGIYAGTGDFTAKKNGYEFQGSGRAFEPSSANGESFALDFNTYSQEGYLRESMTFIGISFEEGAQLILNDFTVVVDGEISATYATLQSDGDVVEDGYVLDQTMENWLEIVHLDTVNGVVQGKFDISFVISTRFDKINPLNPDKVRFSDGSFDLEFE